MEIGIDIFLVIRSG